MATHPTLPCCRRSIVNGQEVVVIETSSAQQITLRNSPASVLIEDANGNAVRLDSTGITITAAARLTIQAPQIEISSSEVSITAAELAVNAAMTTFSGVVQADTIIANTVIPGGGNVW